VQDRLRLRKLFQTAGISWKGGEEASKAGDLLRKLLDFAHAAGGDAPLPPPPAVTEIEDLQRLTGNEQLAALKNKATELEAHIVTWQSAAGLAAVRRPVWAILEKLASHASGLPAAEPIRIQIDAIRDQRLLLTPTDPVAPLRQQLAKLLRDTLTESVAAHQSAYAAALASLDTDDTWKRISTTDRTSILSGVGLIAPSAVDISTDERLSEALDRRSPAAVRAECDAIPGRVAQAIERAAKLLEPKVQAVALERVTLRSEADLNAWLIRQRERLSGLLQHGPVLVS
jgi:hypothetical protein